MACGSSSGVEHLLPKQRAEGSNPFSRSNASACVDFGSSPLPPRQAIGALAPRAKAVTKVAPITPYPAAASKGRLDVPAEGRWERVEAS